MQGWRQMTSLNTANASAHASAKSKLFAQHPEAATLTNPLLSHLRLIDKLSQSLRLLQKAFPLTHLQPMGLGQAWWHYGAHLSLGSLQAHAGISPPARGTLDSKHDLILLLCYGGTQVIESSSDSWTCHKDGCLLLPAASFVCTTSLSSGLGMRIEPERVLHTAMAMGGWKELPHHRERMLERVHSWPMISATEPPTLMWALREVMELVNKLAQLGQPLLDRLQLDDQVYRLVALMLLPELLEAAPLERLQHRERQGRDSFDELIDYIRANLSQPLNLTELEQRSHYSRRALQYAFRERLGCTASQWIRLQRLDLAQRRLQNPLPQDSVASIAMLCGYRSMSLFSVDFQQRFHVKPSQLLREARCAMPMEAATAAPKESEEATKT